MTDAVEIFGPAFSTCVRSVVLVCEEKAIPYTVGLQLGGKAIAKHSTEHYALHPFGKIPVLQHAGNTLVETASILRYLDVTFGSPSLQGESEWEATLCDQWCSLISVYVDRYMVREYMLELAFPSGTDGRPMLDKVEAGRPAAKAALAAVARQLGAKPYLVSNTFSLADAMMAPMLYYNSLAPEPYNLISEQPALVAYIERICGRDSAKQVLTPMQR